MVMVTLYYNVGWVNFHTYDPVKDTNALLFCLSMPAGKAGL